jgi:archaellum biogenesis ATPase FlaH
MSVKTVYTCTRCDAQSPKWQGRCNECGAWGTLTLGAKEEKTATLKPTVAPAEVVRLADVSTDENFRRLPTGTSEIDRVFGGGIVTGSLTLLSGEPGIGKSTLVAQIADALAKKHKIIYTSGEESLGQVKLRLERLGCDLKNFNFINSTDVEKILSAVEIQSADLVIIDSIQTVQTPLVPQEAGSLNQIRAIAVRCLEVAKRRNIAFILIGHVTKDGNIAGPKSLEHLVDTVLYLEQETARGYQLLRASKNRFGSTNELGVFEMTNTGFKPIANPSSIFLEETQIAVEPFTYVGRVLRREFELASGIPIQPHEPIIGEGVFLHESGIHTAGILIHPAIYQFIREEAVGGHHGFVFGKHSGAGAVEEVLKKHAARLQAQGVVVDEALAAQALETVKELRSKMIQSGHTEAAVERYYKDYAHLGVGEEALVDLVLKMKAAEHAAAKK